MNAYTGITYESTRILNPDAPWRESISGGYEGGISIYSISLPLAAELRKAFRSIALKQDDERKAADMLNLCADIADSLQEAEKRAAEREAEAQKALDAWKAEKAAQEAQEGAEAPEEV